MFEEYLEKVESGNSPRVTVEMELTTSCFRGMETVVDGYILDDGIDCECCGEARVYVDDEDCAYAEVVAEAGQVPNDSFFEAHGQTPPRPSRRTDTRETTATFDITDDIADDAQGLVDNPYDYIGEDATSSPSDIVASWVSEKISELLTDIGITADVTLVSLV